MKTHVISSAQPTSKSTRARRSGTGKTGNVAHAVVEALENPNYKWRTLEGVAKDTGIEPFVVYRVIEKLGTQVVKASVASTKGDELFTTRRHFRQKGSFLSRFAAVLRNRAA